MRKGLKLGNNTIVSSLTGMLRVKMDIPEILGTWTGPVTKLKYFVPVINKVILIHRSDMDQLQEQYGKDKLPII